LLVDVFRFLCHVRLRTTSEAEMIEGLSGEQQEILKRELMFVQTESEKKVEKLREATDIHIGKAEEFFLFLTPLSSLCSCVLRNGDPAPLHSRFVGTV
jgi:hypothetical protein